MRCQSQRDGDNAARRQKIKKQLLKMFQNVNHFADEVEINHIDCGVFMHMEKVHQDNKLDSVVVDAG
jgi:hypothetical protein